MHEVAIASLRGEFQRQSSELKLAGEEVSRLRKSLAKKVYKFHQNYKNSSVDHFL